MLRMSPNSLCPSPAPQSRPTTSPTISSRLSWFPSVVLLFALSLQNSKTSLFWLLSSSIRRTSPLSDIAFLHLFVPTFWSSRDTYKFWPRSRNHHCKLCHIKFPKLVCLFVFILKKRKTKFCPRTTRQVSAAHQWSADHKVMRTVAIVHLILVVFRAVYPECLSVATDTMSYVDKPYGKCKYEAILQIH